MKKAGFYLNQQSQGREKVTLDNKLRQAINKTKHLSQDDVPEMGEAMALFIEKLNSEELRKLTNNFVDTCKSRN